MSTLRVDSIQDTAGTDNQGKIIQVVNFTANVSQISKLLLHRLLILVFLYQLRLNLQAVKLK